MDLLGDDSDLAPEARAVADRIAESRGEVSRPFQLLLHSPAMAERVAELGHLVRFGSSLRDRDRELVTLATGRALGCAFVWESHLDAAASAGVPAETIETLERDPSNLGTRERVLVSFVDELLPLWVRHGLRGDLRCGSGAPRAPGDRRARNDGRLLHDARVRHRGLRRMLKERVRSAFWMAREPRSLVR